MPRRPGARRRRGGAAGPAPARGPAGPGSRGGGRGLRRGRAALRGLGQHDRDQRAAHREGSVGRCWRTSTGPSSGSPQLATSAADLAEQLRATQSELGAAGPLQTVAALEIAGQITPVTGPGLRIVIDEAPADAANARRRRDPGSGRPVAGQRSVGGRRRGDGHRRRPAATTQRDPAGRRVDSGGQPAGVLADHDRRDRRPGGPAGQVGRRRPGSAGSPRSRSSTGSRSTSRRRKRCTLPGGSGRRPAVTPSAPAAAIRRRRTDVPSGSPPTR